MDNKIKRTNPYHPSFHFCIPAFGFPGDPNGMFFASGYYHMMFVYDMAKEQYAYGHMRSRDLLHWERLPDALRPDDLDGGIYSGGTYVDERGVCHLSYWALGKNGKHGGIRLAHSCDKDYLVFQKDPERIIEESDLGVILKKESADYSEYISCADPSNIFRIGDVYYMETGNLCALNKNRENAAAPESLKGDWVDLFSSLDLKKWKYEHRFYDRSAQGPFTDLGEDDMCPAFFPLNNEKGQATGKFLQLFISHNRGAQYYVGSLDREKMVFNPESHDRFSFCDNTVFAPEAFVAPDGRLIAAFWFRENINYDNLEAEREYVNTGVYTLFREICLGKEGNLVVQPIKEYDALSQLRGKATLNKGEEKELAVNPVSSRIDLRFNGPVSFLFKIKYIDGKEARVSFDASSKTAAIDTRDSGCLGRLGKEETILEDKNATESQFFLDDSILELYCGGHALARRLFAQKPVERITLQCVEGRLDCTLYDMDEAVEGTI